MRDGSRNLSVIRVGMRRAVCTNVRAVCTDVRALPNGAIGIERQQGLIYAAPICKDFVLFWFGGIWQKSAIGAFYFACIHMTIYSPNCANQSSSKQIIMYRIYLHVLLFFRKLGLFKSVLHLGM